MCLLYLKVHIIISMMCPVCISEWMITNAQTGEANSKKAQIDQLMLVTLEKHNALIDPWFSELEWHCFLH